MLYYMQVTGATVTGALWGKCPRTKPNARISEISAKWEKRLQCQIN
jgi:hypothetical protein